MSLTAQFNRESIDPTQDPVLIGTRDNDGVKQYIVHQYHGWWSGDAIEHYGEEAFREEFGDQDLITLDELKEQYADVQQQRYDLLSEARTLIEDNSNIDISSYGVEHTNKLQSEMNQQIAEAFEYGGASGQKAFEEAKDLIDKAMDIGLDEAKPMRERLESIQGDLKEVGEPDPALSIGMNR